MLGYSKFCIVAFLFLTVASAAVMDARIQEVTRSEKMRQQMVRLEAIRALASLKNMERGLASNIKQNFMGVFDEHCAPTGVLCGGIDEICCSGSCIPHPQGAKILVCA